MHCGRLSNQSSRDTPFESRTKDEVTSTKDKQTLTMRKHECCSRTWRNRSSFLFTLRHPRSPGDAASLSAGIAMGPDFWSLTSRTMSGSAKASLNFLYASQEFNAWRYHLQGNVWGDFYPRSLKVACTARFQVPSKHGDIILPTSKSIRTPLPLDKGNIAGFQAKPRSKRFQRMSSLMKK